MKRPQCFQIFYSILYQISENLCAFVRALPWLITYQICKVFLGESYTSLISKAIHMRSSWQIPGELERPKYISLFTHMRPNHPLLPLPLSFYCRNRHWCSVYGICKRSDTFWPAGRVRLFADYTISLSSLCRLIWRLWTNKMLVRYMLPSVCLRLRLFSQLSFIQYMGLCVFSLPNSPVMIVRMCTLSYYHHQIWSMNR